MLRCRYCGKMNRGGSSYCNYCGGAFASAPAPAVSGSGSAAASPQSASAAQSQAAAKPAASTATATPPPRPTNPTGSLPAQTRLNRRFIILATVGQGGMAAVYRGVDTRSNRQVAIKEMSQDGLSPDEETEALAAFQAEAAMLKRLAHRNLPRVIDIFSDGARHYLVMDFIEGQTLEQRQQAAGGGALPEGEVLRWAAQLCSVLIYLHHQRPPVIFRDLKPANIMVTPDGQIKLIDFGIARVFQPGRVRDTQVLGTPGFAPPEQYGKSQTDARADVYALGVTLYQLLTGYDPATTPFTLPPANTRNPSLSPHIQAAIQRATQMDREARYPSVADFERDLLHSDGFVFRTGQRARSVHELVALCRANPQEAQDHLYSHRFETWLKSINQPYAARAASVVVAVGGDHAAGLAAFMAQATRPLSSTAPVPAVPASPARAPAPAKVPVGVGTTTGSQQAARKGGGTGSSVASQVAGRIASNTMNRLMAQAAALAASAIGTQILVEVRPSSVNFGALMRGDQGSASLIIGGQNGLPVTGRVSSGVAWLRVDHTSFAGAATAVRLTVDTARLPRAGTYRTALAITSGAQVVSVPVAVEVLTTRSANPAHSTHSTNSAQGSAAPAAPPRPARGFQWPGRLAGKAGNAGKGGTAAKNIPVPARPAGGTSTRAAVRAPRAAIAAKHAPAPPPPAAALLLISWLLALGAGAGAALLVLHLLAAHLLTLPGLLPLWLALALALALGAAPAAVIGRWGQEPLARAGTALIGSGLGLGAALLLAQLWRFAFVASAAIPTTGLPPTALVPLLLLGLAGASLGATLGAIPSLSRSTRAALAWARRNARILTVIAAAAVGGWLGAALLTPVAGFLVPVGIVAGVVLAAALASRVTRIGQRRIRQRVAGHP